MRRADRHRRQGQGVSQEKILTLTKIYYYFKLIQGLYPIITCYRNKIFRDINKTLSRGFFVFFFVKLEYFICPDLRPM